MVVALFAGVMSIGQVCAHTTNLSKRRNLQTWLLARLKEEHLGMVTLYLLFFQFVIRLSGGWTLGLIFMCVLMFFCFLLVRSAGLEPY
jgi:hypothetical protein